MSVKRFAPIVRIVGSGVPDTPGNWQVFINDVDVSGYVSRVTFTADSERYGELPVVDIRFIAPSVEVEAQLGEILIDRLYETQEEMA